MSGTTLNAIADILFWYMFYRTTPQGRVFRRMS